VSAISEPAMKITYRDWNLPYGEPHGDAYGDTEARRRHEAGEGYYVLLGEDADHPDVVIRVEPKMVIVEVVWLDQLNRDVFSEVFVPDKFAGRDDLFLEQVRAGTYAPGEPPPVEKVTAEAYFFDPDGKVYASREDADGVVEDAEDQLSAQDVELFLVEPRPEFGHWESLIRRDRDLPILAGS
jgi:hypothetical protein